VDSTVDEVSESAEPVDPTDELVDPVDGLVDQAIDVPLPIDAMVVTGSRRRVAPPRETPRRPFYRRLAMAAERCDDCMANHQVDPHSPLALPGRYERRVIGEGVRLLCFEHVQHWRDRDSLPPL